MLLSSQNANEEGVLLSNRLKLKKTEKKKRKSQSPRRKRPAKMLVDAPFGFTQDGNMFMTEESLKNLNFTKKGGKIKHSKLV
jgi:hypothetical protein